MRQSENRLDAIDLLNLEHGLMSLREVLTHDYRWGQVRTLLEALCSYKNKETIAFIGKDAESRLSELRQKYYDDTKYVEQYDVSNLQTIINRWVGRIDVISQKWILCVPRAHLDVTRLTSGVKGFLDEQESGVLDPLEQQGLDEATSCLLFNNFTSAEFIALRSVESLLRRWYEKKTGNALELEMWGDVLEKLSELYPKKRERPKELALLDYLRGRRNEIAHPQVISNPEEATSTFLNVIAVCKAVKNDLIG
jgi:hypothetical protein